MKTHILLTAFITIFLAACASHEGRSISSTEQVVDTPLEYAKHEAHSGAPIGPR